MRLFMRISIDFRTDKLITGQPSFFRFKHTFVFHHQQRWSFMLSIKTEKQQHSVSPADQTKLKKVEPVPTHSHWKAMVHGSPQSSNQVFQKLLTCHRP
ncbi:uncharacterized protein CIMG_10944 [Coccidioides immitis RS]|uniref:Uncharacterized protein n=2 Tax=Coccidioides immitis TaxID=5501 RepID=A0A0D8JRV2_COCIM|nr:uncharacterized protein CIMG_10944 [Coccidioides immitis RS]KJF60017.1 hypothetical protein CIMG_10944 [Coccidioides immitis RS]KMU86498.1 hypothetical protein CIHG_04287 [Coccidioides immitis H538.4]